MKKPFGKIFWGVAFIIIGLLIIMSTYFHINVPVFKTLFALVFIYLGVLIFTGGFSFRHNRTIIFNDRHFEADESNGEFNVVFGSGKIDLTKNSEYGKKIKINVAFGEGIFYIDPAKKYVIYMTSAFGQGVLPNNERVNFGSYTYKSENSDKDSIIIDADVAFGNMEILFKKQ